MSTTTVSGNVLCLLEPKENAARTEQQLSQVTAGPTCLALQSVAESRRYVTPNYVVSSHVPVPASIVYTESANLFLHYIIALDLCRVAPKGFLLEEETDCRYCHLENLEVVIHSGSVVSVEYRAYHGRGFRLPKILLREQT